MLGHKNTGAARIVGALLAKPANLSAIIDTVVFQDGKLDLLGLSLVLLGGGVCLLLLLLGATAKAQDKVEGGFLLNVVVRQSAAVLELLASKNKALLVRRNS